MNISKRLKEARTKIDAATTYDLATGVSLIKETATVKFDASIELHVNLGIDAKKSDQMIRSVVSLPYGTGKEVKIAAFVPEDQIAKAREAGASIAGAESLIEEIKKTGKCDFDVAVATPDMMKQLAGIARILGQKGLMPNPRTGTIAPDVTKLVKELKQGKVSFKNDAGGVIHVAVGKASFPAEHLTANIAAIIDAIHKAKPQGMKGNLIRSMYLASSMGPSVRISVG